MIKKNTSFTTVACGALLLIGTSAVNASSVTSGTFEMDFTGAGFNGFMVDQTIGAGTGGNAWEGFDYIDLPNGTAMSQVFNGTEGSITPYGATEANAVFNGSSIPGGARATLVPTAFDYDETAANLTDFVAGLTAGQKIGTAAAIYMATNTVVGDFSLEVDDLTSTSWIARNQIDFTGFAAFDMTNLTLVSNDATGFEITGDLVLTSNLAGFWGGAAGDNVGTFSVQGVSAVPVPAAIWLFGSALAGLSFSSRRKKTA